MFIAFGFKHSLHLTSRSLILSYTFSGVTSYFGSEGDVRDFNKIRRDIRSFLIGAGMMSLQPMLVKLGPPKFLLVLIDGHVVGSIASSLVENVVDNLRKLKVSANTMVCCYYILFTFPLYGFFSWMYF